MTATGMSFDHVMETACTQTITISYQHFYVWKLDLRLNNINYYQLLSLIIIDICINLHHSWTSESIPKVQILQISK